jgi:hypothetical protein
MNVSNMAVTCAIHEVSATSASTAVLDGLCIL